MCKGHLSGLYPNPLYKWFSKAHLGILQYPTDSTDDEHHV